MMEQGAYTIYRWLKSKSNLTISEDAYYRILADRNIDFYESPSEVSEDNKDLITADLFMELYTYPTQITESVNDQGYSKSASIIAKSNEDYKNFALDVYKHLDLAKYQKWNSARKAMTKLDIANET